MTFDEWLRCNKDRFLYMSKNAQVTLLDFYIFIGIFCVMEMLIPSFIRGYIYILFLQP